MSQPPFGQYGQQGQGPPPQQRMKPYTFRSASGGRVTISDDAVLMSPVLLKHFTFKRIRWAREEVAEVSVRPLPRNRCEVTVTRRDGTMRRYGQVQAAAAEVESAFAARGYGSPGPGPDQ